MAWAIGELRWATIDLVLSEAEDGTVTDNRIPIGQDYHRIITLTLSGAALDLSVFNGAGKGFRCQIRRFKDSPIVLATPVVTFSGSPTLGTLNFDVLQAESSAVKYLGGYYDLIGYDESGSPFKRQRLAEGRVEFAAGVTR